MLVRGKEISRTPFRIRHVPRPVAKFGDITYTTASALDISKANNITFTVPFAYQGLENEFNVLRYSLAISHVDTSQKATVFTGIEGDSLTPEIKTALNLLKSGDSISVFDMEVMQRHSEILWKPKTQIMITVE